MQDLEVIDIYTRVEALYDGQQFDLSSHYPEEWREVGFRFPVFCARSVWFDLIEAPADNPEFLNDRKGIVWDILNMLRLAIKRSRRNMNPLYFTVVIQGSDHPPDYVLDEMPHYRLTAEIGPLDFDNPEPAITISFPADN
ncbi:MAG: DUF6573 family protein [Cyanobacteria bacterium J06636_16]